MCECVSESEGQITAWDRGGEERMSAAAEGEGRRCSHLHIKAQVLLLFKEEIEHKLPHKVGVERVIDHLRPTELEGRQRGEESQHRAPRSEPPPRGESKTGGSERSLARCCVDPPAPTGAQTT